MWNVINTLLTIRMINQADEFGMTYMIHSEGIFVGKLEGKKTFGKCRNRWQDNIKTDLRRKG